MAEDRHPFERIALSLSGGGTRAMGFHLGTLSYLDRIGLLEKVRILSTVSGGSAIGIGYAAYRQMAQDGEKPLMTLYREMHEQIPADPATLLSWLQEAAIKRPAAPSGRRTLISNLAEMCNTIFKFCDDNRFDIFWNGAPTHLEEIIFNATEFMTGVGFRFHRSSRDPEADSGCAIARLPAEYARKARLADIMAASACIPIGFEPLEFPEDFRWPDEKATVPHPDDRRICLAVCRYMPADPKKPDRKANSITLMDGGVYDNQGVFSALNVMGLTPNLPKGGDAYIPRDVNLHGLFSRRRDQDQPVQPDKDVDLFIVSDTPLREFPIYELADKPARTGFLDLEKLKWIIYGAQYLLLGSSLCLLLYYFFILPASGHHAKGLLRHVWDFFVYVNPLMITSGILVGTLLLSRRIKNYFGNLPAFRNNPRLRPRLWEYFKNRKFSDLSYIFESRLSSAFKMNSDILLNRIRYLGLTRVFKLDPLKNKVIINVIDSLERDYHELQSDHQASGSNKSQMSKLLEGSKNLRMDTVAKAATVPTQFWLAKEDLADLLACGQATICYNLLKHLQYLLGQDPDLENSSQFRALYEQLEKDWQELKSNPYYLVTDPYRE